MRGGSVRLTRAVRLAACGKEPEEKLSEQRQQTADKSDLSSKHRKKLKDRERKQNTLRSKGRKKTRKTK